MEGAGVGAAVEVRCRGRAKVMSQKDRRAGWKGRASLVYDRKGSRDPCLNACGGAKPYQKEIVNGKEAGSGCRETEE